MVTAGVFFLLPLSSGGMNEAKAWERVKGFVFGESLEASRTTDTVYTIKIRKEGIPGAAT